MVACYANWSDGVLRLTQVPGIDLNAESYSGTGNSTTALIASAHLGLTGIVRVLLSHDEINVDVVGGQNGNTALTAACCSWTGDNIEILKMLLDAGSDVNHVGEGEFQLWLLPKGQ